jgi:hypothetical protein
MDIGRTRFAVTAACLLGLAAGCTTNKRGPPGPISVQGAWSGTAGDDAGSIPILFTIADDGGALSGVNTLYDPTTGAPILAGSLTGQRTGNSATWTTLGGLSVTGTFNGNNFSGTATFPGALNTPALETMLRLNLIWGAQ